MARPSRWMQFSQNFNAMKGTLDKAFKQYDINQVGKQDFYAEDGTTKLTGDALSRAKNEALAGVYEKWGDAEGALNLRTKGAQLEGLMRTNRIGAATEEDQIYVQGKGARAKLDAGIGASNASARLSNLQADAAELAQQQQAELTKIFTDMGQQTFASKADEDAYLMSALGSSSLPPAMRASAVESVRKFGSEAIGLESDRLVAAARDAVKGGVPAFTNWYNRDVADGFTLEVGNPAEDGSVTAYAVRSNGEDSTRTPIYTAKGDNANIQVLNYLYQQVRDPTNILGAAVSNLAYQQSQATFRKTEAEATATETTNQTLGELTRARIDDIKAQTAARGVSDQLNKAQIDWLGERIAASEFERDTTRSMTPREIQEAASKLVAQMAASGIYDEKAIQTAKDLYLSMMTKGNITIEQISSDEE